MYINHYMIYRTATKNPTANPAINAPSQQKNDIAIRLLYIIVGAI